LFVKSFRINCDDNIC